MSSSSCPSRVRALSDFRPCGLWGESFFHLPTVTIRNTSDHRRQLLQISPVLCRMMVNLRENPKKYMKLQCNQDQLPAPEGLGMSSWFRRVGDSTWGLSVASADTRRNSTQKEQITTATRSAMATGRERYIQENPKQWTISIIYNYYSMNPRGDDDDDNNNTRAQPDTRNHNPPSIHSSPRHHHRDALVVLHPQFSQICPPLRYHSHSFVQIPIIISCQIIIL
ncbi:hypothetical protein VC83_05219 [Pseudogymnoascus destructans]|uniref:Uncharacterized protein n=1 Tax=Pseudogymnoascus destructans TaxID=655981 RepID=A0A177A9W3_9PEZI|nr:uncharacterized protein VC83_05219 [Pseudogymnoascus destructans]OAF58071.1 hypothetical protein VC83_05219 [Pseudogymnoascus destructans]